MMRQYLIILFLLLILSTKHISAQSSFLRITDTLDCNTLIDAFETSDHGYFSLGGSTSNIDRFFIKMDSTGGIQWIKSYSLYDIGYQYSAMETPDSGFMICGISNGQVVKSSMIRINKNGDTLWTKSYAIAGSPTMFLGARHLSHAKNLVYATAATCHSQITNPNGYLFLYLNNGIPLTPKHFNLGNYDTELYSLTETLDSGFIMVGSVSDNSSSCRMLIIKTNLGGDTLWTKEINLATLSVSYDIVPTQDSGFVVLSLIGGATNSFRLIRLDSQHQVIWNKDIYYCNYASFKCIRKTPDDGFVVLGTNSCDSITSTIIIKTYNIGDTLWSHSYPHILGEYISITSDGGILISGNYSDSTGNYGALLKTDSLGNVLSLTGIKGLTEKRHFNVYPNPTNKQCILKLSNVLRSEGELIVYNTSGQIVDTFKLGALNDFNYSCGHLIPGLYQLIINNKDNILIEKLLISE